MNCKAYLVHRIGTFPRRQGPPPAGLGRDSPGRARARRHGHVVARHRGRDRRGQGRTPRRDGSLELLLPRFLPDDPTREPVAAAAFLTLAQAYSYDPAPDSLGADVVPMILGVQGNLWCEHVPTAEHAEHMIWPRLLAIAEVGWSAPRTEGLRRLPRPRARRRGVDAAARIPPLRPEKCRRPPAPNRSIPCIAFRPAGRWLTVRLTARNTRLRATLR